MTEPNGPKDDPKPWFEEWMTIYHRFDLDPSIENYLAFRRFAPRADTEIYRFMALDLLPSLQSDLRRNRINPTLLSGALDGNDRELDELCLQLMEQLVERARLEKQGGTHLQSRGAGVSNALVDHLIVVMVEALQRHDVAPPPSLVVLIRERLGGPSPEIYKQYKKQEGRADAAFIGYLLSRSGVEPTIRKVAKKMGIAPSTVSRWFEDGDFLQQVEAQRRTFNPDGLKITRDPE